MFEIVIKTVSSLRLAALEPKGSKCEHVIADYYTIGHRVCHIFDMFQAPVNNPPITFASEGKVRSLHRMNERLACLEPHWSLTFFKSSFSTEKLYYMLKITEHKHIEPLQKLDHSTKATNLRADEILGIYALVPV